MAIFHFLGVTAVLVLIYALLLVGCEKKLFFILQNFQRVIGTRLRRG